MRAGTSRTAIVAAFVLAYGCGDSTLTPTVTPSASPTEAPPGNPFGVGPYLVRDIRPGSASSLADPDAGHFFALRGRAYFAADDGVHGLELWTSDGTAAGTQLVADICPGACFGTPVGFAALGGRLLFDVAMPDGSHDLWTTDGTAAATRFLREITPPGVAPVAGAWQAADGIVYFGAGDGVSGRELWATDGTAEGTRRVRDICPGPCDAFERLAATALDRRVFFAARDAEGAPTVLWVSDGTEAGTRSLEVRYPGTVPPATLGAVVLFDTVVAGGAPQLWRSDGTREGTALVAPIAPTAYFEANGLLFMPAFDGTFGEEPWVTDGTTAGTRHLGDIAVGGGNSSSTPRGFVFHEGRVFFAAFTDARGSELWSTDGTAAGTRAEAEIRPGSSGALSLTTFAAISVGGRLFFPAGDGQSGLELWAHP